MCEGEGEWENKIGGHCEGWHTQCAPRFIGSDTFHRKSYKSVGMQPCIHHKYLSNTVTQSHAPFIMLVWGKLLTCSLTHSDYICKLFFMLVCLFLINCIIKYNKNKPKNLTLITCNPILHFKACLFIISRQCCRKIFFSFSLRCNWINHGDTERTFFKSPIVLPALIMFSFSGMAQ